MKIRTLAAALALTLAPALAFAQCMDNKTTSASACGDSMVYDAESKTCVQKPTS